MGDIEMIDFGYYYLQPGDNATKVARKVYGDPHKASVLLNVNDTDWDYVEQVVVPNKKGRITKWQEVDSPHKVIARLFPEQPVSIYMQPFFIWNGGVDRKILPGEVVFVPER
jgi:hypothetical protein